MPTYRNDSTSNSYKITDINGIGRDIKPGESIESYEIKDIPNDFTTIDAEPYFSPSLVENDVSSEGTGDDQEIELQDDTDALEFYNDSAATITLYFNSMNNTQTLTVQPYSIRTIEHILNKVETLYMVFDIAGSCVVSEIRRVL